MRKDYPLPFPARVSHLAPASGAVPSPGEELRSRTRLGPRGPSGAAPRLAGREVWGCRAQPRPVLRRGAPELNTTASAGSVGEGSFRGRPAPAAPVPISHGGRRNGVCCSNPGRRQAPRPGLRGSRATPSQTRKSLWMVEPNPFPQDYPDFNLLHPEHVNRIGKPRPTARKKTLTAR